jgi:hypothetical protein
MRTWARARLATRCGACPRRIAVGEPMLQLTIAGVKRPKVRCSALACAEEAMPQDIPAVDRTPALKLRSVTLERLGVLPLDFSRHAAREPGEEG